ncbi:zinc-ribbon domain-containing protein [Butyrivibrio sp. AE2032]
MPNCIKCGELNNENANYCRKCGTPLKINMKQF